jgi:glycerophosphoryl diester phosphodiesterase
MANLRILSPKVNALINVPKVSRAPDKASVDTAAIRSKVDRVRHQYITKEISPREAGRSLQHQGRDLREHLTGGPSSSARTGTAGGAEVARIRGEIDNLRSSIANDPILDDFGADKGDDVVAAMRSSIKEETIDYNKLLVTLKNSRQAHEDYSRWWTEPAREDYVALREQAGQRLGGLVSEDLQRATRRAQGPLGTSIGQKPDSVYVDLTSSINKGKANYKEFGRLWTPEQKTAYRDQLQQAEKQKVTIEQSTEKLIQKLRQEIRGDYPVIADSREPPRNITPKNKQSINDQTAELRSRMLVGYSSPAQGKEIAVLSRLVQDELNKEASSVWVQQKAQALRNLVKTYETSDTPPIRRQLNDELWVARNALGDYKTRVTPEAGEDLAQAINGAQRILSAREPRFETIPGESGAASLDVQVKGYEEGTTWTTQLRKKVHDTDQGLQLDQFVAWGLTVRDAAGKETQFDNDVSIEVPAEIRSTAAAEAWLRNHLEQQVKHGKAGGAVPYTLPQPQKEPRATQPLVPVAHRGRVQDDMGETIPQNTVAAVQGAIDLAAKHPGTAMAIEIDVYLNAPSGKVVVTHDRHLRDRLAGYDEHQIPETQPWLFDVNVEKKPFNNLIDVNRTGRLNMGVGGLDVSRGSEKYMESLPTLDRIFELVKKTDVKLMVEVKESDYFKSLVDKISELSREQRQNLWITSFYDKALVHVPPGVKRMRQYKDIPLLSISPDSMKQKIDDAAMRGYDAVNVPLGSWNGDIKLENGKNISIVEYARQKGLLTSAFTWISSSEKDNELARKLKLDYFMTDKLKHLTEQNKGGE